jgi:hypothetical protein
VAFDGEMIPCLCHGEQLIALWTSHHLLGEGSAFLGVCSVL